MKKFRRIISGFLAAALVFTQSVTTAYSDDQPDTAVTTVAETIAENAASDEKPDADDPDNENDETAEDGQVKDDEYYDALRQSIEEKEQAAIASDTYGMGYAVQLTEEEWEYLQSQIAEDYAKSGLNTDVVAYKYDSNSPYATDYYYNRMSAVEKTAYDSLYAAVNAAMNSNTNFTTGYIAATISNLSFNEFLPVYRRFYYSNPQFFFIDNAYSCYGNSSQFEVSVKVNARFRNSTERNAAKTTISNVTASWLNDINKKTTSLLKQEDIYTKLCQKITYTPRNNSDGTNCDQDIAAALVDGACVCNGYALAAEYFCNAAGLDCITVTSSTHAWNIIKLYDNWYEMDVTWMDTSGGNTKWINKSHATILAMDKQNDHNYDTEIWTTDIPETKYDVVQTNGVESITITTQPTTTTYIYGTPYNLTGGVITATLSDGTTKTINMTDGISAGTLTVANYNANRLGKQTLTLTYEGKSTTLDVTVVVDPENPPVTMNGENYLTLAAAVADIKAAGNYTVTVNDTSAASLATLTVPATATSVTLKTKDGVSIKTDSIRANTNLTIEADITSFTATQSGADITIASGKTVNVLKTNTFRKVTGTTNTTFKTEAAGEFDNPLYEQAEVIVDQLSGVQTAEIKGRRLNVLTSLSATTFGGELVLDKTTTTATITNIGMFAFIKLRASVSGGAYTVAPLTVTNVPAGTTGFLNTVVVDAANNFIALPSGTTVFKTTANGTFSNTRASIGNKTSDDKNLSLFKYGTDVKAQFGESFKLVINSDYENQQYFPTIEMAFAAVQANKENVITLQDDMTLSSFTLPASTKIGTGKLIIDGAGDYEETSPGEWTPVHHYNLILPGTATISPGYEFEFQNMDLYSKSNGANIATLTINGSKNIRIENVNFGSPTDIKMSSNANLDLNGKCANIRNLSGTVASDLSLYTFDGTVNNVTTFRNVSADDGALKIAGKLSAVSGLRGDLCLVDANASAEIGTITAYTTATLCATVSGENCTFGSLKITDISDGGVVEFFMKKGDELAKVSSGTVIMTAGDANKNFTDKVIVNNKTEGSTGKDLTAFKYGTSIKAEVNGAVTLKVTNVANDEVITKDYPNIELALAAVPNERFSEIILNEDIDTSSLTLPTNLGTSPPAFLRIRSADPEHIKKLTLRGISTLSPKYNFDFMNIELIPLDNAGKRLSKFMVSGTGGVGFRNVTCSEETVIDLSTTGFAIDLDNNNCNFGTLTGNANAFLQVVGGVETVENIKNFGKYVGLEETLTVSKSISGVDNVFTVSPAKLIIEPDATANITGFGWDTSGGLMPYNADIVLLKDTTSGKLPELTVTDMTGSLTLTVKSKTGTVLALEPETKLLTSAAKKDFTPMITVANKTSAGKALNTYLDGSDVKTQRADGDFALLVYNNFDDPDNGVAPISSIKYPTLDKALKAVQKDKFNNIIISAAEASINSTAFPTDLGSGALAIMGEYDEHGEPLVTPTISFNAAGTKLALPTAKYKLCLHNFKFKCVDRNNNPVQEVAITSTDDMNLFGLRLAETNKLTQIKFAATGADSFVALGDIDFTIAEISGRSGTGYFQFQSPITVKNVTGVDTVSGTDDGLVTITGAVTNTKYFNGKIKLAKTSTATINTISRAKIIIESDGTKLPALTANYMNVYLLDGEPAGTDCSSYFTVVDGTGNTVAVPSGTKLFTLTCNESLFNTEKYTNFINIVNKTALTDGKPLNAFYYNREIRAEYAGAITLSIDGDAGTNYPNFEKAFAAVEKGKTNTITLNESIDAAKFVLPTTLAVTDSLTIRSLSETPATLTLHGVTSLSPKCNFSIYNVEIIPLNATGAQVPTFAINSTAGLDIQSVKIAEPTTVNLTVGAKSDMRIIDNNIKFGSLNGTATSSLYVNSSAEAAEKVVTFGKVVTDSDFTVTSTASGIASLCGTSDFILEPAATATITTLGSNLSAAKITLFADMNGTSIKKLAKLTATKLDANKVTFTIKDKATNAVIALPTGTPIFTMTCTEAQYNEAGSTSKIFFTNKTATNQMLNAYYYTREIRAEYAGALTLSIDGDAGVNYPNFEKALLAVQKGKTNTITLNESIDAAKFVLPTLNTTDSLTIRSLSETPATLTLHGVTSLSPKCNFSLYNVEIIPLNTTGTAISAFAINSTAGLDIQSVKIAEPTTVSLTVGAKSEMWIRNNNIKFGSLNGTATSSLYVSSSAEAADRLMTFGKVVTDSDFTVTSTASSIASLCGTSDFILEPAATATITTLGSNLSAAKITLFADMNGTSIKKLAKLTATKLDANKVTFTIKDKATNAVIALPTGTPIFTMTCTEAQYNEADSTSKIFFTNKTATDQTLNAYYYTREIRAEYAGALTLSINGGAGVNYPNFEKAFGACQSDKDNQIKLNENINTDKFVLPTNLGTNGSLTITGGDAQKTITLTGITSLSPKYTFKFDNINIVSVDKSGNAVKSFSITGAKDRCVTLTDYTSTPLTNVTVSGDANLFLNGDGTYGTLTGSSSSRLDNNGGETIADTVTGFGFVGGVANAILTINKNINCGKTEGAFTIKLANANTNATMKNVEVGKYGVETVTTLILTEENRKISKATINSISGETKLNVKVVDEDGIEIPFDAGSTILYVGGNEDISGMVNIVNKTNDLKELEAVKYGKEIRGEVPGAVKLYVNDTFKNTFTSFEKLFEEITALAKTDTKNQNNYRVEIFTDISTKTFNLPNNGASFTVKSAEGNIYGLELRGVTIAPKSYPVSFDHVDVTVVK